MADGCVLFNVERSWDKWPSYLFWETETKCHFAGRISVICEKN